MQTDIRVLEIEPFFTCEKSRTPLKFGGVVMDTALCCHAHPLDLFWRLESDMMSLAQRVSQEQNLSETMPRMAALVSASPVDAALHDAFGNAAGIDVYQGYGPEHMDHDLSTWLGPKFAGRYIADYLRPPDRRVDAFHLVGRLNTIRGVESNSRQFYPATSAPERRVHPGVYRLKNGCIDTSTIRGTGLGYQWDEIARQFTADVPKQTNGAGS